MIRRALTRAGGDVVTAGAHYYLALLPVLLGVGFGVDFLTRQHHPNQGEDTAHRYVAALASWDGVWYGRIIENGYNYDRDRESNVAFFPGYPLAAGLLRTSTGLSVDWALLTTSHLCLLAIYVLIAVYKQSRDIFAGAQVALALTVWPMTLFFRMAYSESLFVLLELLVLLGIARRWPLWVVAIIGGAATAVRAVGVALLLPLVWDCWRRSGSRGGFVARAAAYGPLACWGLLAYMAYLHIEFDDALAFVKTQVHWAHRADLPFPDRIWTLASLEPLWSVYVPSSEAYWARFEPVANPLFSLQFWNPIYFVTCVGLVAFGAYKRWLTTPEILLAAGLLAIPYLTHSYRAVCMAQGRYAASVFPAYIVMGRLAERMPPYVLAIVASLLAVKLAFFSALFAAWYRII